MPLLAAKPAARSLRLLAAPTAGMPGHLQITKGALTEDYLVFPLAADWGRGFRLVKVSDPDTVYDVNVDGATRTCDCMGGLQWSKCKHQDALAALVTAGKL